MRPLCFRDLGVAPAGAAIPCCNGSSALVLPTTAYVDILTPRVMMALEGGAFGT